VFIANVISVAGRAKMASAQPGSFLEGKPGTWQFALSMLWEIPIERIKASSSEIDIRDLVALVEIHRGCGSFTSMRLEVRTTKKIQRTL
jgi:hypothetical protein